MSQTNVKELGQGNEVTKGLRILIVGAGIGGLTAAIALRREGHIVEVYEQSRFANEIGAAIYVVPNAVGVLQRLGVLVEDAGAVELKQTRLVHFSGEILSIIENSKSGHRWQNKCFLVHRAHLHSQLKEVATSKLGEGCPVRIHTSHKILSVEPESATISYENESTVSGDVIVGADGVHSICRLAVPSDNVRPFKTKHSALRFLVSKEAALADPITREFAEIDGATTLWYAADRKVVCYPCAANKLLNFVCIHPSHLSDASNDYNKAGSKAKLLEIYDNFEPTVQHLLAMANEETLSVYPLFDMETLPSFCNERLAVIGDAAHPFTPHLAQGAAMAIEDAVSLATMLPRGTASSEVTARLGLYNQARYQRATTIQGYSRLVGSDGAAKPGQATNFKVHSYIDYGFSHDEWHASTKILRDYQWQQNREILWRQPTIFGPIPGPGQHIWASPPLSSGSTLTATIKFKTSATLLRNFFPSASYRFAKSDTVGLASFVVQSFKDVPWLGGHGYQVLSFYIHDVEVETPSKDKLQGSYCPIMFDNQAESILAGREELGLPKLYSEISLTAEQESDNQIASMEVRLSWRDTEWASFRWQSLANTAQAQAPAPSISTQNASPNSQSERRDLDGVHEDGQSEQDHSMNEQGVFVHKFVPATNTDNREKSKADADYDVLVSWPRSDKLPSQFSHKFVNASFNIHNPGVHKLPTLHHVVSRLAEIPVFEKVAASFRMEDGVREMSIGRRLH